MRKQKSGELNTKSLLNVVEKLSSVPAELPANKKVAATYLGHESSPMTPGYPWNSVGRLLFPVAAKDPAEKPSMDFCTATRVSTCHVLTAAHCVTDGKGFDRSGIFVAPFEKVGREIEKIMVPQGDHIKNRANDWALLQLKDSESGKRDGWLGISDKLGTELIGKTFSAAGYSKSLAANASTAFIDKNAEVVSSEKGFFSGDPNYIFLRANAGRGGSGGPIFSFDESGKAWIVGLMNAGSADLGGNDQILFNKDEDAKERLTHGVAANAFAAKIKKLIDENPCK